MENADRVCIVPADKSFQNDVKFKTVSEESFVFFIWKYLNGIWNYWMFLLQIFV